jgi:hypothetical protein
MLYKLLVYAAKIQVWSASVGHPVDYFISSVTNDNIHKVVHNFSCGMKIILLDNDYFEK